MTYPVSCAAPAGRELLLGGRGVGGGLLGREPRGGVRAVRGGDVARHVDPGAGRRVRRVHLQQRGLLVLFSRVGEYLMKVSPMLKDADIFSICILSY